MPTATPLPQTTQRFAIRNTSFEVKCFTFSNQQLVYHRLPDYKRINVLKRGAGLDMVNFGMVTTQESVVRMRKPAKTFEDLLVWLAKKLPDPLLVYTYLITI
jgi:hypothetical protein